MSWWTFWWVSILYTTTVNWRHVLVNILVGFYTIQHNSELKAWSCWTFLVGFYTIHQNCELKAWSYWIFWLVSILYTRTVNWRHGPTKYSGEFLYYTLELWTEGVSCWTFWWISIGYAIHQGTLNWRHVLVNSLVDFYRLFAIHQGTLNWRHVLVNSLVGFYTIHQNIKNFGGFLCLNSKLLILINQKLRKVIFWFLSTVYTCHS